MTALSQSILWKQIQTYYDEMGPEIWEDEVVPSQITSNTYLANLYARLMIAQINDYYQGKNPPPKSPQPFHIIEIGAGHGKFSFYVQKALAEALAHYKLPDNTVHYIMTDISEKNIESWNKHPALQPFVKNKTLDFAFYNALTDDAIPLKLSKKIIKKGELEKPIFIICNYILDTLPHDAFQISDDSLYETELVITDQNTVDIETIFENNQYTYNQNKISKNYYPNNNKLNSILEFYKNYFDASSFLIPIGGINAIDQLRQFSQSATMMLIADKGTSSLELFDGIENPDISYHGSVSMMVNFDALARYTQANQGVSLLMGDKSADFQIASFIYQANYPILHTQYAFHSALSAFSLQDLFNLCYKNDEPNTGFTTLDEILAIVNLSDWDPNIFYDFYPQILEFFEQDGKNEKNEITIAQTLSVKHGLDKVWDRFFKLEKTQDIPYALGALLYTMDEPEKAIQFYNYSLEQFGEQEETLYNIAVTYQLLEDDENALRYAKKSLDFNPKYKEAKELIQELT